MPGFGSLGGPLFLSFGADAMDGATLDIATFRTPARILIPKLVASRDGWKRKAGERKRRLKAARIRIRDLEASRERWHERASEAERKTGALSRQLEPAQQALAAAKAEADRLRDELKKKWTPVR
jgi:chromosome segregation ATPase